MSQILIAQFYYGPLKLPEEKIPEAILQATAASQAAERITGAVTLHDQKKLSFEEMFKEASDENKKALGHLLKGEDPEMHNVILLSEDLTYDLERICDIDPEKAVRDFVQAWNEGTSDSVAREVPGHKDLIGHVFGGTSSGDTPDGFGYTTVDQAYLLGILPVFGVR